MKNNSKETKELLKKVLSSMPSDFAFNDVKYHVKLALSKIEKLEKSRESREKSYQERKVKEKQKSLNPRDVLISIEEMIEAEQMKLKNLQNKNKFSQEEEKRDEEDNGEFQYLG
jgi:predicted FMN-binding regulatory protein PaiB